MSNEPKREDYPTDDAFIEAMARHHGIDPRMCKQMPHNLGYLNKPGFLEKDDVIKMQADQIECLRKEVYGLREANQMYINDIIKIQQEQMKDQPDVLGEAIHTFMAIHRTNELMGSPWIVIPLMVVFFGLGAVGGALFIASR